MKNISILLSILFLALTLGACNTIKEEPEEFIVSLDSLKIEIGEIEVQFDRFFSFGDIKKQNVAVFYFPIEDAVCLQYRYDFYTYHQFWSRKGRTAFLTALEKYKEAYDARSLTSGNKLRTKRSYGVTQGYLIWQMNVITRRVSANMNVELGYCFERRSPYFTVYQKEAYFVDPISRSENKTSSLVTMYFTRAQADELAALFDPAFLRGLSVPRAGNILLEPERDEY